MASFFILILTNISNWFNLVITFASYFILRDKFGYPASNSYKNLPLDPIWKWSFDKKLIKYDRWGYGIALLGHRKETPTEIEEQKRNFPLKIIFRHELNYQQSLPSQQQQQKRNNKSCAKKWSVME